jgi:hypothetical protein
MLVLFDDLYDNKAYLNALHDWLLDEDGGESVRVKAVRCLLSGEMVIVYDRRGMSSYKYDLLVREYRAHNSWTLQVDPDHVANLINSDSPVEVEYGVKLAPYVGWHRYSYVTPTDLFGIMVWYLDCVVKDRELEKSILKSAAHRALRSILSPPENS